MDNTQGVRGLSALFIVTYHFLARLDPNLAAPAPSENAAPRLLQLPILRIIVSGRANLAFFFLLTGTVNGLSFLS